MKKIMQEINKALKGREKQLHDAKELRDPIEILKEVRLLNKIKVLIAKFEEHEKSS